MPAGNPAPSRAHRELALPLRRHKDRPRFGRLHDCGLRELASLAGTGNIAASPATIISRTTSLWGSMRPEFSPCLTATSIEPPKAPPRS